MKIGYIRVSTTDQNTDRQRDMLAALGVEKIYEEKASGKNTNRPELQAMLAFARDGDTIVVESYSRLARSTADLLRIVDDLTRRGVQFVSIKESIDTTTPSGKLMLTIFAGLAQFERETTLQRQKEGIDAAKRRGKHLGRPRLSQPESWPVVLSAWRSGHITAAEAIRQSGVSKTMFYRMAKDGAK